MNESILLFFSTIRWQDAVDIVLNSYILFRVYALFRGTRVFRILVGMGLFWLFHRLAVSVGLILTSWALQGIIAAAALIIIVVFRNEIRAVLQAKTFKAILWGFPSKTEKAPVETVVDALFELSAKRVGALIVFPGKEDLDEVVQSGIPWDGLVSKEMITNIFWGKNPVHDGAAVVESSRVTQVGAILPLSRRDDLPSYYGTRHRAAAGLAESTDALAVLVSEERGQVLLATGLRIEVVASKKALIRKILSHVGQPEDHGEVALKDRARLLAAGIASIVFVTGAWFSFTRGFESMTTLDVPIEYMNRSMEKEIVDTSVDHIRVNLGGSGPLVHSLRPGQVQVRLDLSGAAVGRNAFIITAEDVDLPPGIVLKEIQPQMVEVFLDTPMKKELPVQVRWTGKMPEGMILTEATVVPSTVTVIAGKKVIENVTTIYTEKVQLSGMNRSGTTNVKLILRPASLRLAPGSRDTVTVTYVVNKRES